MGGIDLWGYRGSRVPPFMLPELFLLILHLTFGYAVVFSPFSVFFFIGSQNIATFQAKLTLLLLSIFLTPKGSFCHSQGQFIFCRRTYVSQDSTRLKTQSNAHTRASGKDSSGRLCSNVRQTPVSKTPKHHPCHQIKCIKATQEIIDLSLANPVFIRRLINCRAI